MNRGGKLSVYVRKLQEQEKKQKETRQTESDKEINENDGKYVEGALDQEEKMLRMMVYMERL